MTPDRYDWEPFSSHLPKQASAGMPTTVTVWSLFFTTTILVSNAWAITCFSAMVKSGGKWWNKPCKLGYDKSSQLHYTSWQRIVPLRCQRGWKIPHGPSIGVGERSSEGTLKILGRKKTSLGCFKGTSKPDTIGFLTINSDFVSQLYGLISNDSLENHGICVSINAGLCWFMEVYKVYNTVLFPNFPTSYCYCETINPETSGK